MNNKKSVCTIQGRQFCRIPIKTKILTAEDDIYTIALTYTDSLRKHGDIIVMSESPVAITQGRALPESEIKIGWLANILWRGVRPVPYGVGLRAPSSMQCAIDECGRVRIIFAAFVGLIGKILGRRGWFYRAAGKQAALVDAAHTSPIPPYNTTVIKGPIHTHEICQNLFKKTNVDWAIMDINDIGGSWVIGHSNNIDVSLLEQIMKDNPQGQQDELTPLCIIREIK